MAHTNTRIYHITYYDHDKSAYVQFLGCNFKCLGCVRNRFAWDHHLYEDGNAEEVADGELKTLTLDEFKSIIEGIKKAGLKRAVLGGGEPTIDPAFRNIVTELSNIGLEIFLLTNGFLLDKVLSFMPKDSIIELSIKSVHPKKFSIYTGRSEGDLDVVLRNAELAFRSGFKMVVETILIPDFNESQDVELLAEYVASNLSNDVLMVIDEYVPVPSAPWRRPTLEELLEAKEKSERHLRRVVVRSSYTMNRLGRAYPVYPELNELRRGE